MLIIGSQAMAHHFPEAGIVPNDTDIIGTMDEFRTWSRGFAKGDIILCKPLSADKMHVRTKDGHNYEFEIATAGSSSYDLWMYEFDGYASLEVLLLLKLSHRYRRNSPHFLKTMRDIQFLREQGVELSSYLKQVLPKREKETYTYAHPRLAVTKDAFFDGDGVPYIYEHDSLHEAVALTDHMHYNSGTDSMYSEPRPAYTFYSGGAVWSSKELFFKCSEQIRLYGVYEESCVLALERSQIPFADAVNPPHPRKSFEYALMKVCTSITSGWFREFAWESYDKVLDIYEKEGEDGYLKRFNANKHLLKLYKGGNY